MIRMLRAAGVGLLLGLVWGVVARVWMHFLTDDPQFTWAGSIAIVVLTSMTGALVAVVREARLAHRTRWWRLAALPTLILFASPGMILLPAYVLGGFSVSGRGPSWLRWLLGAAVVAWSVVLLFLIVLDDSTPGVVIPTLGWVAGSVTMALAGSHVFRRWHRLRVDVTVAPAEVTV